MSKLGDLIKQLRGKESLRDASKKIGISHTYLSIIEKGFDPRSRKHIKPTPETLKLISKAYDYPYQELMKTAGYLDEDDSMYGGSISKHSIIKEDPQNYKIGNRIISLRQSKNWSQQELADKLDLNRSTLTRYELNDTQADYDTLCKLADIFDVTVDFLLGRDELGEFKDPFHPELEEFYNSLLEDPDGYEFFRAYLKAPKDKQKKMRNFWRDYLQDEEK